MTIISSYDIEYPDTLEVKESPIHGNGVFALVSFSSGDLIMSSLGVNSYEMQKGIRISELSFGSDYEYITILTDSTTPTSYKHYMPTNEFKFLNNGLTNSTVRTSNSSVYATKNIAIGEELTLNYNTSGNYN